MKKIFICGKAHIRAITYILENMQQGKSNKIIVEIDENW